MPTYIYNNAQTLNNVVAPDQLAYEIQKNPNISKPISKRNIIAGAPTLDKFELFFQNALLPAEQTELETIVIPNHTGEGLKNDYILQLPGEPDIFYQDMFDALDDATPGSTIVLPTGIITVDQTITVPSYVLIKGKNGFDTTEIHPTFNDADVFVLQDFGKVEGVSIKYPSGNGCCVRYSGIAFAHCKDILMFGGSATSKGIVMDGLGILTAREIFHSSGDANMVMEVSSGELDVDTFAVLSGNVFGALNCLGGEISLDSAKIGKLSSVTFGAIIDNSAEVDLGSCDFKHAEKSICYRNKKGKIRCRGAVAKGTVNSIEVDPGAYPYDPEGYFIFEGLLDSANISAPVGWDVDPKTRISSIDLL